MKIYCDDSADYLEILFRTDQDFYESSIDSTDHYSVFKSVYDDTLIGYGVTEPFHNLGKLKGIDSPVKLAAFCKIIRVMYKLTQEELAEEIDVSSRMIQRVENFQQGVSFDFLASLKKIEPSFDLNDIC